MTFSFRIHREHGAFAASAICIGDVVPVRASGRLSTCTKTPQNKVHAPALFASVPFLPLPPRRVRSLHEGKAKRVDGAELDALQLAKIEEVRREYRDCKARLEKLEKAIADLDTASSLPPLAAYRAKANDLGRMDIS